MASCSAAARVEITACGTALAICWACSADGALACTAIEVALPNGRRRDLAEQRAR